MNKFFKATAVLLFSSCIGMVQAQRFTLAEVKPGTSDCDFYNYAVFGNKLIFSADDGVNGSEPWISDGTPAGTKMIKNIYAGSGGSLPSRFTVFNGKVYFSANDGYGTGQHGTELWVTDGTESGTKMLKDIRPGIISSEPSFFAPMGGKLYFNSYSNTDGNDLWVTDGTTAGTKLVKSIGGAGSDSKIGYIVGMGSELYFSVYQYANGENLWTTDGTDAGTVMVKDFDPVKSNSMYILGVSSNRVYMSVNTDSTGTEIWGSDGTAAGTVLLKDIYPGKTGSFPLGGVEYKGKYWFNAESAAQGNELWCTDGTPAGTKLFKDINFSTNGSYPNYFTVFKDKLYFVANDGTQRGVFSTDGTAGDVQLACNMDPGAGFYDIEVFKDKLYLSANEFTADGGQLWVNDGTSDVTTMLTNPAADKKEALNYTLLFPVGDHLFLMGASYTKATGKDLWVFEDKPPVTSVQNIAQVLSTLVPNPANDRIQLSGLSNAVSGIQLIDAKGSLCKTVAVNAADLTLEVADLPVGLYTLRVVTNEGVVQQKIMIAR